MNWAPAHKPELSHYNRAQTMAMHDSQTLSTADRLYRFGPILFVAVVGCMLALSSYFAIKLREDQALEREFRNAAQLRYLNVQNFFSEYLVLLELVRGTFQATDFVSRSEFKLSTDPALKQIKGIQAISWNPRVSSAERSIYRAAARADGFEHFEISDLNASGQLVPAKPQTEYYPAYYVNPLKGNASALGFNLASSPSRFEALQRARDSGTIQVSERVTLVQEKESQFGVLAILPVYHRNLPQERLEDRRANLKGFVVLVLRGGDFIEAALSGLEDQGVAVYLHDMSAPEGKQFLHAAQADDTPHAIALQGMHDEKDLSIGGHIWRMTCAPKQQFYDRFESRYALVISGAGFVLTLVLCAYLTTIVGQNQRIRELVAQRTEELRKSEERLDLALVGSASGLWDWNVAKGEVYYSEQWATIHGYDADELPHSLQTWETTIHPEDLPMVMRRLTASHQPDFIGIYQVEYRARHKAGTQIWVMARGRVVDYDAGGKPLRMIGIIQDITARKTLEQQLLEAKEEADKASRAKSDFLANMSHEIRTPMNAVIGLTDLALKTQLSTKQQDYLSKIRHSSHSLLRVINDILDFSKIEAGKLTLEQRPFVLQDVLTRLNDVFGFQTKDKGLDFAIRTAPDVPSHLTGDSLRLEQVLMNLIGNAFKFTSQGMVELLITLGSEPAPPGKILLQFSVRDTGIGIAEQDQRRLFESFTQADTSTTRRYGGSGLGLAICKRLVELMHGQISVQSTPGQGSVFTFSALLTPGGEVSLRDASVDTPQQSPGERLSFHGQRVLLAEDNEINQQVAREILEMVDIEVEIAFNGQQAVDRVLRGTTFDAVLMDIQMPLVDGYEATRAIRADARFKDLPIIAMTAHAMAGDREHCLAAGMNDYVSKPVDTRELYETLSRWLKPQAVQAPLAPAAQPRDKAGVQGTPADGLPAVLPDALPGIDVPQGLERLGGNAALFHKLLVDFATQYADFAVQLSTALEAGDFQAAHVLVHTLKGVAGNIAAMDLFQASKALDRGLRRNQQPTAGERAQFDLELENLLHSLNQLTDSVPETAPPEGFNPAETSRLLHELRALLTESNFSAAQMAPKVRTALMGSTTSELAATLEHQLLEFDFSGAGETVDAILSTLSHKPDGETS
ncbi:MAG: CHASE domain-containing protein [Proteobacteria bacterium]|nr:CHASE domain-containing protein [Pseudomonadota bacterium]